MKLFSSVLMLAALMDGTNAAKKKSKTAGKKDPLANRSPEKEVCQKMKEGVLEHVSTDDKCKCLNGWTRTNTENGRVCSEADERLYDSKKLVVTGETLAEALLARQNTSGGASRCAVATGAEKAIDCSNARMDGKRAKKIIVPASTKKLSY